LNNESGLQEKIWLYSSKKGDKKAFSFLVKKYEAKIFNLAFSLTGNREVADDVTQESFIKAYFGLPKFQVKSEFGTWLYRIAVDRIKDYLRKKVKLREIPLDGVSEKLFAAEEAKKSEPEQEQEKKRQLVHRCLRTLPEKYRFILALRDIRGFSYEEISRILEISLGTVDSRLHRARKMLRRKLLPYLTDS
jgi:RNA polymerase sigma-70 factor (ECF subfamily)